jgi:alpha-L-rhamnosidase
VDLLSEPIGLDDARPVFSWKIRDTSDGARQTAYRVRVTTGAQGAGAVVWDSGRVASAQSTGVAYGGTPLQASCRYFWTVESWDQYGKPYPVSPVASWETGLLSAGAWKGGWIGYEQPEDKSIRESGAEWITNAPVTGGIPPGDSRHDFRLKLNLKGKLARAELLTTGEDVAGAWVNGKTVLEETPMPPWKQTPWQTYMRREVTRELHGGENLIAIEVRRYAVPNASAGGEVNGQSPMSTCLYLENTDGSTEIFISDTKRWKAMLNAPAGWEQPGFADATWQNAVLYAPPKGPAGPTELTRPWPTEPVDLLRKEFTVDSPVASARLYVTALGSYVAHMNGAQVGDQIMAPGWTDYRERVPYQTFDVTQLVRAGKNAIGAYLAPGWYIGPLTWFQMTFPYGNTPPAFKAQLRLEHSDGKVEWVHTDRSWKATVSEISQSEIYNGETVDARKAVAGWDRAPLSEAKWKLVEVVTPSPVEIVAQDFQPIRVERVMTARAVTSPAPGVYIYDFGQDLSGVERLQMSGRAGQQIKLRFAEVLNPDGTLYTENLRTAKATDYYTFAGSGNETFEPKFTFHGFRYAELTGVTTPPALDAVQAVVFHTDAPFTAELTTGDPMINQLWSNILWGQRGNFIGVPTDCPQRDERLGWTADAQVFWRTASYNMALGPFSRKFSRDLRGTQVGTPMYGIYAPGLQTPNPGFGMGWSDAGVIIPWTAWLQTGDARVAAENWEAMDRYLEAIRQANPDSVWKNKIGIPFGDWLAPGGRPAVDLVATAFWAYDTELMEQMAQALQKTAEEKKYSELHDQIKEAFTRAYVHSDGYVGGGDLSPSPFAATVDKESNQTKAETQTGYVLAIHMRLLPDNLRKAAGDRLAAMIEANGGRLSTGFLGTPYLLAALTDTGHPDVAYKLLLSTEYPSWGYLVKHGATTMWERWNGDQMRGDPSMNSYNHYAYGAVADWIYRYAAGMDAMPGDPGFHTIFLHPHFDARLKNLTFSYETPYGTAESSWRVEGTQVRWQVTVPANSQAVLEFDPAQEKSMKLWGAALSESPRLSRTSGPHGAAAWALAAGSYSFEGDAP